jgi:hypothetical protein
VNFGGFVTSKNKFYKIVLFSLDQSASQSASKIVKTLLTKIRLQREDDEVDVALYVPILKILMLYPEKLKYNISTILVQTSVSLNWYWFDQVHVIKLQEYFLKVEEKLDWSMTNWIEVWPSLSI